MKFMKLSLVAFAAFVFFGCSQKAPVVESKQKLDDVVAKALPLTHATEKSSMGGNGILALAMSGLVALGGLIYKHKHL